MITGVHFQLDQGHSQKFITQMIDKGIWNIFRGAIENDNNQKLSSGVVVLDSSTCGLFYDLAPNGLNTTAP